jgi:hypothetical protein
MLARLDDIRLPAGFVPEHVGGPMHRRLRTLELVFTPCSLHAS